MVEIGSRNPSIAGLREQEYPNDVDFLLQARESCLSDDSKAASAVGLPRSLGDMLRYVLLRKPGLWATHLAP